MSQQIGEKYLLTDEYLSAYIRRYPDCARVLDSSYVEDEYLSQIAHTKRFLERYVADCEFREALARDPQTTAKAYKLQTDPEEIRVLWDAKWTGLKDKRWEANVAPSVRRYRCFIRDKKVHRERVQREVCLPAHNAFRIWRQRQVNRLFTQFGKNRWQAIVHPVIMFEISKGCSVGCWFCGLSAGKKEADFLYTEKNARVWREILNGVKKRLGPAASSGVLYWATDPLDNPDYEKFCLDQAHLLGRFPQTTTAQADKHIERVRKLIKLSRSFGGMIDRFSILSLDMLDNIHNAFTPEELLFTELIMQNKESTQLYSRSGRAMKSALYTRKADELNIPEEARQSGSTIACMSGFLINMVDSSIKLITPCLADENNPHGFRTLDQTSFSTPSDFLSKTDTLIEKHMNTALSIDDPVAFRPDIQVEKNENEVILVTPYTRTTMTGYADLHLVSDLISRGNLTAGDIALQVEEQTETDMAVTFHTLNDWFNKGFFNEQ